MKNPSLFKSFVLCVQIISLPVFKLSRPYNAGYPLTPHQFPEPACCLFGTEVARLRAHRSLNISYLLCILSGLQGLIVFTRAL